MNEQLDVEAWQAAVGSDTACAQDPKLQEQEEIRRQRDSRADFLRIWRARAQGGSAATSSSAEPEVHRDVDEQRREFLAMLERQKEEEEQLVGRHDEAHELLAVTAS